VTGPTSSADTQRAAVLAHFDAKIRLDEVMLSDQLTEDAVWWAPRSTERLGMPRPLKGRKAIVDMLMSVPRYEPGSRHWTLHHVAANGDVAFVHATLQATTRMSKMPYENDYVFVFSFRDGLIDAVWEHLDTAYAYDRFAGRSE
jgi:ketosteroid isomerase-like protein